MMGINVLAAWLALAVVLGVGSIAKATDVVFVSRHAPNKCLAVSTESRDNTRTLYADECTADLNRRFVKEKVFFNIDHYFKLSTLAFEDQDLDKYKYLGTSSPDNTLGSTLISTWEEPRYELRTWLAISGFICKSSSVFGPSEYYCITLQTDKENVRIASRNISVSDDQQWISVDVNACSASHYPKFEYENILGGLRPKFTCTACPSGTARDGPILALSDCEECEPGFYQDEEGQATCKKCEPGTQAPSKGSWSCTKCDPGSAQRSPGMAMCNACGPGSYQDEEGQTTCKTCEPGTFASLYRRTECTPCSPGHYQPSVGMSKCLRCPSNTFETDFGSLSCSACPSGTEGSFQGTSCCPENQQLSPDRSQCVPIINGTTCNYPELVVEALAHGLVSITTRETADVLTGCMRTLLSRGETVPSRMRNAADARLGEVFDAIDPPDSEAAAAVAHVRATVRFMPSELGSDDGFTSWVTAPGPLPGSISSGTGKVDADVEAYTAAFGSRSELVGRCVHLIKSQVHCGCGRKYVNNECSLFESSGEFAAQMSLAAFCSSAVGFVGSHESLQLAQFAQHCAVSRAEARVWQQRDQRQMFGLVLAVRDVVAAAGSNLAGAGAALAEEYRLLAMEALPLVGRLRKNLDLMDAFSSTTALHMKNTWQNFDEAASEIKVNLKLESIEIGLEQLYRDLGQLVKNGNDMLLDRIAEAEENTNQAIVALGALVSEEAAVLKEKQRMLFKETMTRLADTVGSQLNAELGQLEVTETQLNQLDLSFAAVVSRIREEQEQFDGIFDQVVRVGGDLANNTYKFLECVKIDELHKLAKQRLNAIFNIIKGAVKAIADVGAFVLTGGVSKAAKISTDALAEARKVTRTFRASPSAGFASLKDKILKSDDLPLELLENKDDIRRAIKGGQELADIFADLDITSADSWLETGQAVFAMAGDAGVPGAKGAEEILGGVLVLTRYGDQVKDIKDQAEAKLEAAREVFSQVSALVEEIAAFAATLVLEFCDVMLAADPPATPSVAQSSSLARWAHMGNTIIRFLQGTNEYKSIQSYASGAMQSDRLAPGTTTSQGDSGERLRLRRLAHDEQQVAHAGHEQELFSRSLVAKEPDVAQCDPYANATIALATFERYFELVGDAMTFGEAMHRSMVNLVDLARETKVVRVQRLTHLANIKSWNETMEFVASPLPDNDDDIDDWQAPYQAFLARLPTVRRLVPYLDLPLPDVGEALARTVRYNIEAQREADPNRDIGTLREACNFLEYTGLTQPDDCLYNPGPLLAVEDSEMGIEGEVRAMIDRVGNQLPLSTSRSDAVFRLHVDNLLGLRLHYSTGANETRAVPDDAVFELDLRSVDSSAAAKLAECGHTFDLLDVMPVLENVTDAADVPLFDPKLDAPWKYESTVHHTGPFVKLDENARRSVFVVDSEGDKFKQPPMRQSTIVFGNTPCPSSSTEFDFRRSKTLIRGCFASQEQNRRQVYPALGRFTFGLPKELVAIINTASEDEPIELALYVRVSFLAYRDADLGSKYCEVLRHSELRDAEVPEDDGSVSTLAAAAAAAGGAVVVLAAALAVTVKRRRQRQQRQQQGGLDDAMRKSCDNPKFAVAVAQPQDAAA